jgi:ribosomal protein S18 acetylase RimI-like enzyme
VWIGVKAKYEGRGYGQSAMRTIIHDAKKKGIKKLTLEVPSTSPNARHIYEKLGFKDTGEAMLGNEDDVWGGLTKMELEI